MDESGSFEGDVKTANRQSPLIFGIMVPEDNYEDLALRLENLRNEFKYSSFVHAAEKAKGKNFIKYLKRLMEITASPGLISFVMEYDSDILVDIPEEQREAFAANRYQSMLQALVEYLVYLYPPFLGKDIKLHFHPNSRVFPAKKEMVTRYKKIGLNGFQPKGKTSWLLRALNSEWLHGILYRMTINYWPWREQIGNRAWGTIETPQGDLCKKIKHKRYPGQQNCAFMNLVDNLAWLLYMKKFASSEIENISKSFAGNITISIPYGDQLIRYRQLLHTYFRKDFHEFIPRALSFMGKNSRYFRSQLESLVEKAIDHVAPPHIHQIERLEQTVAGYLRSSAGNWRIASRIIDFLFNAVDRISDDKEDSRMTRLMIRLYGHSISIHNHRGEFGPAWKKHNEAMRFYEALESPTVEDYREYAAFMNRRGVTAANIFAFAHGNDILIPVLENLEQARAVMQKQVKGKLRDELIGKIKGTIGQNHAFLAGRRPGFYADAEKFFLSAKDEFESPQDALRQDIYLVHLYLDHGDFEKADKAWQRILNTPEVNRFVSAPSLETARYMQFVLQLIVKMVFFTGKGQKELLKHYNLEMLNQIFGSASNEHPFEFIFTYLGVMHLRRGKKEEAEKYFRWAVKIPGKNSPGIQPTLQAIRAWTHTMWAVEENKQGIGDPCARIKRARDILFGIGTNPDLAPMLCIKGGKAVSGWFSRAWNALAAVDWEKEFSDDACKQLLDCFTFNYH